MNEMTADAWFYTREGERIGPVSFTDLRVKASEGGLNPRLDMAWTQGMAEWKPVGEVEGLFERKSAPAEETRETLAPAADPYTPPQENSANQYMQTESGWPGARRRSYLFAILILPILWNVVIAWSSVMLKEKFGEELVAMILLGAMLVPVIAWIYYSIQRLVNLGMSGWWFLGNFVPLLNLWVGYRCFACPAGYAYHKKLDGVGIALAIFYWLSILAAILAFAGMIALLAGAAGSPDAQEKFNELLRLLQQQAKKP